ncbi:MAG TPA: DUF6531 domain-containing protein, partial [Acidimicrobiales bacterium]|nr:DUF6531 domain-containing protein [Acidimicrobiales bacterium]
MPGLLALGGGAAAGVAATVATPTPAAAAANPTINNAAVTSPAAVGVNTAAVAIQPGNTTTAYVAVPGAAGTGGFVKKVTLSSGAVAAVAGGAAGSCANGSTGATSSFGAIKAIATDGTNVYSVGDCSSAIRKTVISTGATSTLSTGVAGANYLTIVGTTLYVTAANAVWKVTTSGTITATKWVTLATGITAAAITPDVHTASPAPSALYVAEDTGTTHQIQKIVISSAAVTTLAGASADLGLGALVGYSGYVYDAAVGAKVVRAYNPADGTWTNIAGSGSAGNADGTGTEAWFAGVTGMAADGTALWLADSTNNKLRKAVNGTALTNAQPAGNTAPLAVSPGAVTTFAGNGTNATTDGTGTAASFQNMGGTVVVGTSAYVGTVGSVRKVDTVSGAVTRLAGDPTLTGCVDSTTGTAARFGTVADVASDTFYLYVSDTSCGIRRVSIATGATSTLTTSSGGGHLTFANGTVYVSSGSTVVALDRINGTASTLFTAGGPVSTLTSDGTYVFAVDTAAGVNRIVREPFAGGAYTVVATTGVGATALSSSRDYLYDSDGTTVRRHAKADGSLAGVAGSGLAGYGDGTGAEAWLSSVTGLMADGSNVWVADSGNHRLRKIVAGTAPSGTPAGATAPLAISPGAVSTFAGSGGSTDTDGSGTAASFSVLKGTVVLGTVAYTSSGTAIRRVDLSSGTVTTLAGALGSGAYADSQNPAAVRFYQITDVASDGTFVYTVSSGAGQTSVVRRTSIATGATSTVYTDYDLTHLTVGPGGMLFVVASAESGCCSSATGAIYKVDPMTGAKTDVVARTTGLTLYGIAADATTLWVAKGVPSSYDLVKVDPTTGTQTTVAAGVLAINAAVASSRDYVYASAGTYVRRFAKADGTVANIAGTSGSGYVNATGTDAWFSTIQGLFTDGTNVWVADSGNHRLRKIVAGTPLPGAQSPNNTTTVTVGTGLVSTYAGAGTGGGTNGTGTAAHFDALRGTVVIGGAAYVADFRTIRRVDLATGAVTVLAGSSTEAAYVDAPTGASARFMHMTDLTTDGTYLYTLGDGPGSQIGYLRRTSLVNGATSTIYSANDLSKVTYGPGNWLYVALNQDANCCGNNVAALEKVDPVTGTMSVLIPQAVDLNYRGITSDASNLWLTSTAGGTYSILKVDPTTAAQTTLATNTYELWGVTSAGSYLYATTGYQQPTAVVRYDKATGASVAVAGRVGGSQAIGYADGLGPSAWFRKIPSLASDGTSLWVDDDGAMRFRRVIPGPTGGPTSVTETPTGSNFCLQCLANWMNQNLSDVTYYPVNAQWGNFFHTFGDLSIPGRGKAIGLARTYNSDPAFSAVDSPFGFGWSNSYGVSLAAGPTQTVIHQEDGSQVAFDLSGSVWVPHVKRTIATLTHNGDGSWTFVRKAAETITFDSTGRLTGLSDRNGYLTAVTYPTSSTQVITDPAGRTLTLTFTGAHVTSAADSAGRSLTYAYDGSGNLTDVIDVGGGHWVFTYDASHRMLTMRSPKFYGDTTTTPTPVVTNHYNASGWVDWQSDPLGRVTTFDYTTVPGSTKISDPQGNVVLDTYSSGLLASVTKGYGTPQAATWTFGYDPATGSPTEVVDPNGGVSTMYVDASGNVGASVDLLGRVTKTTYNAFNEPTSVTDPAGVTTTVSYDTAGNVLSRSTPLLAADGVTVLANQTTTYNYGGTTPVYAGDVTSIVDPVGKTWTYRYDAYGDPVSTTAPPTPENASGNKTTYAYDTARGWLTSTVAPKGNLSGANPSDYTTTIGHDLYGRVTSTKDPLWSSATPLLHQATQHYDANGNLDSSVDANGNGTSYTYDAAGQLLTVTRPDTTTLRNDYWADGSLHNQYDGANQATTYAYDALGRVTSVTDPLLRVTAYGYDPAGNLVTKKDPGGSCSAPVSGCTTRTYDAANQLTSVTYSDGTTPNVSGLQYDADGRRTTMTDGTGTSVWAYDSLGRLTTSTNGASSSLGYTYDIANRPTGLAYPGGTQNVTRSYDDAGRLASLTDWSSRTTSFTYDADSNLVGTTFPNGTSVASSVDRTDAMTGSTLTGPGSTTLASLTYTRDGAGQMASQSGTGLSQPSESYGYNALEQLSTVNGTTAFAYDHADNLTQLRGATQA